MTQDNTAIRQANLSESTRLLQDPVALRHAWLDLRERHHHLHGPEAAALLGVPEAALIASKIGDGAHQLEADLPALLSGCPGWGKLLFAARNPMGVALGIMDDCSYQISKARITLRTAQHEAQIDADAAHSCYLLEDHDGHGHTCSLNWFDAAGDVIGRLFLMAKSGREVAMPFLLSKARPVNDPGWNAGPAATDTLVPLLPTLATTEPIAAGSSAVAIAEQAILSCSAVASMQVRLEGVGASLAYRGPLAKTMNTPPAVHAVDAGCKLHLRMQKAVELRAVNEAGKRVGLQIREAGGGSISLVPEGDSTEQHQWINSLLAKART